MLTVLSVIGLIAIVALAWRARTGSHPDGQVVDLGRDSLLMLEQQEKSGHPRSLKTTPRKPRPVAAHVQDGAHGNALTPEALAHIQSLLTNQKVIEAIKMYRENTGATLQDSKTAIEHMRRHPNHTPQTQGAYDHYTAYPGPSVPETGSKSSAQTELEKVTATLGLSRQDVNQLKVFIKQGQYFRAVKFYKAKTGKTLKESGQILKHYAQQAGRKIG